ncbi:hypothetical protein HCG51_01100 [Tolypothrix sp. PCC 7910]|uniref:hypothetical protein n=1 Tax=Tolypothrix sp. PCC 7910 TaxID=2099387 RepID=UPI0014277046|nr:hypothetical protein [Tolypothrix sp. PCC 7910]QIR35482.1 hypothetical protein HCG51_01100 [Tolypothrix sp. PCC 7910]
MNNNKLKDMVLAGVISTLVGGSLVLAIIDENYRSTFIDLAKVGVGGYIGLTIPKSQYK